MNFLSHDYILPEGSPALTRVGSALPDLWSILDPRPLPLVVLRELDAVPNPKGSDLARGIRSHLAADAEFHGNPVFRERVAWLAPQLKPTWDGLRHASLAAHVLVEMILDGWIVEREPHRLDDYYTSFSVNVIETATELSTKDEDLRVAVSSVLHRFARVQFLRDYATTAGTVDRFVRLLMHTPFVSGTKPDWDRLVEVADRGVERFGPGSRELLESVREASDRALGESQAG